MVDKGKTSIKDIANAMGVSITTISFVLNGKAEEKRISSEVEKKVLNYVEKVGYKPSVFARGLRTGKSHTIGLLVESIADPFFSQIARIIEEKAGKKGYEIIYGSTNNETEKTRSLISVFNDRKVDGFIIAAPEGIKEEVNSLKKNGIPVVLFDRKVEGVSDIDYISVDNFRSVYNAVEHLVEGGYRNIALVTLDSLQSQMQERLMGYEQAIADYQLNVLLKELSYYQSNDQMISQITDFLKRKSEIDAVIFATNYLGINGLKAIRELNIKIPTDLAVLVFDDADLFELYSPSITTISQPIEQMAEQVISAMLNRLRNNKLESKTLVLPTSLKIRESSHKRERKIRK